MKQKINRKDLKRNELAETMTRTADYVTHHRRGVTEAGALLAVAALIVAAIVAWRAYRASTAGRELSAALEALSAPLAGQPGATAGARSFPTAADREKEAEPHLRKAASYSGTAAGRAAAVILAAREPGAPKTSETLARIAREARAETAAVAQIDEARLLASQGKTEQAVDRLKRAIESSDVRAPKDALLFELGEIYEKSGSAADARATFQRLVNDYPNSAYKTDARAKLPGTGGQAGFPNPS